MKRFFKISLIVFTLFLASCATGKKNYNPPTATKVVNTKIVKLARDKVWAQSIPKLSKTFYQINTIDKDSGLLSLSISANPEKYVNCGRLTTSVQNARGARSYDVNLASKNIFYEELDSNGLWQVNRTLSLDAKINLVFEAISKNETQITVNTRYLLGVTNHSVGGMAPNYQPYDTTLNSLATFDYNTEGKFNNGSTTACYATGELESEILGLIN